jgi:hypothetical protein
VHSWSIRTGITSKPYATFLKRPDQPPQDS